MSLLDKLHHICIVVADIEKAQAYYEAIGVGPWQDYPPLAEYKTLTVPNAEAFRELTYRVCNLPNVQLQLCQPPQKPCPQRTFLDTKGEGVFHVGFEVADADEAEAEGRAVGMGILSKGRRENGTGFTYFDTAGSAGVVLLTRATNPTNWATTRAIDHRQPADREVSQHDPVGSTRRRDTGQADVGPIRVAHVERGSLPG